MTGPAIIGRRAAMGSLEDIEKAAGLTGWGAFEKAFAPAEIARPFEPDEQFKRDLAFFAATPFGRDFFNWLYDLTCRAPYPVTSQNMQDLAYAAAKHQARSAVGEVIARAKVDGDALLKTPKEET